MGRRRCWKPQRQMSQETAEEEFDPAVLAEVESLFKRQFEYSASADWQLPSAERWLPGGHFTDETLQSCKEELNEAKCSLSDYDINKWQEHTSATNRAGLVISYLRRHRKPELCTQAWCKFHEVINTFPVLPSPQDTRELNTVHLCEAPGAFISSLNHFIKSKGYRCQWEWRANTLNPYYEGNNPSAMITEDSFIRETLDHWLFGEDNTGDIMSEKNIMHIQDTLKDLGPVNFNLVTADGSIDCQNNPGEQEGSTSPLHLAEVVAALHILSPGGTLVLKTFTLFESCSFSLIYLLNCIFKRVCVTKPATSKSGNSEVYVVCLEFKGIEDEKKMLLRSTLGKEALTLFHRDDLPLDFVAQHRECVRLFAKFQLQTIEENRRLHGKMNGEVQQKIEQTRRCCALSFISRFNVKTLPLWQSVAPSGKCRKKSWSGNNNKTRVLRHVGSYNHRQKELALTWAEQIARMEILPVEEGFCPSFEKVYLTSDMMTYWRVVTGKQYQDVLSSKFCDGPLLKRYTSLLSHSESREVDIAPCLTSLKSIFETTFFERRESVMDEEEKEERIALLSLDDDTSKCPTSNNASIVAKMEKEFCRKVHLITPGDREHSDQVLLLPTINNVRLKSYSEVQCHMLNQLVSLLKNAEEGDHCLFAIYESFTRFSAGIVFVLMRLFSKTVVVPSSSGLLPYFLLGFSFQRPPGVLLTYLTDMTYLAEVKDAEVAVLQFAPIYLLCEDSFLHFIIGVNNEILRRSGNYLLAEQKRVMSENGAGE